MLSRKTPLRRTPMKRMGFSPLKRSHLKHRSPTKKAGDAKYAKAKAEQFRLHPGCQWPGGCTKSLEHGDAMDCHHAAGRNGPLLYCAKYLRTACRPHHNRAKDFPIESRANGWIVDVSSEEVRALKLAELGL